jgi:hypothetical protein
MNITKTLLAVAFCLCATNKAAAYDFSAVHNGQTIYYNITSSTPPLTATVTHGDQKWHSYQGNVTIPETITHNGNTYTVTAIGDDAFRLCSGLTAITIPLSVTTIGKNAFTLCFGLTSLTIPHTVTFIGKGAFMNCNGLTSITIPASVTTIEGWAFANCNKLTAVTIPHSVTSIGVAIFAHCHALTSIAVDANNTHYCAVEGTLFTKLQDTLLQYPAGKSGSYTIPSSVTCIKGCAFGGCRNLTSIIIPPAVTTIGGNAFASCHSLTSVTIPHAVTFIGEQAFRECRDLKEIHIKAKTPPQIQANTFDSIPRNIPIRVCGDVEAYRTAEHWDKFTNITPDSNCD